MKRVQDAWPILGCLFFVTALALPFHSASSADPPNPQLPTTEDLIKQLGSDRFEAREEATRLLSERPEAAPALRAALKSPDSEIASRASSILDGFVIKAKKQAFARLAELGNNGDIDRAIELFVQWKEWDDENDCWQVIFDLNRRLIDLEKDRFGWAIFDVSTIPERDDPALLPLVNFRRFVEYRKPEILVGNRVVIGGRAVARGKEVVADNPRFNNFGLLFVASERIKATYLRGCFAYAGQEIEVEKLYNCVVFCDGDVTVTSSLERSMIIARGTIRCPVEVRWSHLISSGNVVVPKNATVTKTEIKENEATPLGFVKFFDPARLGLTVEPAEGGLKVKAADEDKVFAKAGLRAADLIIAADDKPMGTPDEFRRLLRRFVVVGQELPLKVMRGSKTLEIVIPFRL